MNVTKNNAEIKEAIKQSGTTSQSNTSFEGYPFLNVGAAIDIIDSITINESTYLTTGINETGQFRISAAPNTPTLNAPANASIAKPSFRLINITVSDPDGDAMNVSIYGDNSTASNLIAFFKDVTNNTQLTYNWTAPTARMLYFTSASITNYYDFDKNASDSIKGLTGTLNGNAFINASGGQFGGAAQFDGIGDYVEVAADPSNNFSSTNNFTVAAWIYSTNYTLGSIASKWDGGSGGGRQWRYNTGGTTSDKKQQLSVTSNGATTVNAFSSTALTNGVQYHVAVTWNNGAYTFYKNGVADGTGTTSVTVLNKTGTRNLCIGAVNNANNNACTSVIQGFNGSIDDLQLWNRSLSASEISALFSLSNGNYYWKADANDGSATTTSATREFTIANTAPTTPTLNAPANASVTTNSYQILNVTVTDLDADATNVSIYGDNQANLSSLLAFFQNVANGTTLTYNWTAPTIQVNTSDTNQVSIWRLDTNISDTLGINNGTTSGTRATLNQSGGYFGGAYKFGSTTTADSQVFIQGTTLNGISTASMFTVAAWININSIYPHQTIFSVSNITTASNYFQFMGGYNVSGGNFLAGYLRYGGTDRWLIRGGSSLAKNTWYHAVITYNGTNPDFYVNGVLETKTLVTNNNQSKTLTDIPGLGVWRIGSVNNGGSVANSFNGTIDEVGFWNRSLSAAEISSLYALSNGTYYWKVNASDGINITTSATRQFLVGSLPSVSLNSPADAATVTSVPIQFNFTGTAGTNSLSTCTLYGNFSGTWAANASTSPTSGQETNISISPANGGYVWNVQCSDINGFTSFATSNRTVTVNVAGGATTPDAPVLLVPSAGDGSITDRTPTFTWNNSASTDGVGVTYDLQVDNSSSNFTSLPINQTAIAETSTNTSFTPASDLSTATTYFWRARATDNSVTGNWSSVYNFTLLAVTSCSLPTSSFNFGSMEIRQKDNTTDNSPPPLLIQNDGNLQLNISINASSLFNSTSKVDSDYQFKIDINESSAFASALNNTWINLTTTRINAITNLYYPNTADAAEIEILITVPGDEAPGSKNSTITIECTANE